MFIPVLLLSALLFSNGCGKSLTALNQLAASGSIQEDAAVKAYLQVEIDAPAAMTLTLLVDAGIFAAEEDTGDADAGTAGRDSCRARP